MWAVRASTLKFYACGHALCVVDVGENHLDVMSQRPGVFHKKHGANVMLLEEDTVAQKVGGSDEGVVFTRQPIPQGSMFQVKLLGKGDGFAGYFVSGVI